VRPWCSIASVLILSGCAGKNAPSVAVFGAWFPAWLLCALIGVIVALGARAVMVASGLDAIIPWQLLVCLCCGLIGGCLFWLIGFGQ
jgi:hypothetical protein